MTVAAVIPWLPERAAMFHKACDSVREQTRPVDSISCMADVGRTGNGARIRNLLIGQFESEWVACLDDDDWWLPRHVELLLGASEDADVVVALYEHSDGSLPAEHCCDYAQLRHRNWFHPSACLLRRQLVLDVGGFPEPEPPLFDDWALWINLLEAGARFTCVHEVTNIKGIHPGGISQGAWRGSVG